MQTKFHKLLSLTVLTTLLFGTTGCTVIFQKGRRTDIERISRLKSELSDLERAKQELEDRLRQEIADKEVAVEMRGGDLVVTFVSEVLFDSGKAKLRESALSKIDKISGVLTSTVRGNNVGIEGHTDNIPIKHSGWKSNWELSTARALSVVHYLIDKHGMDPKRLAAIGYGENRSIASNDTKSGRQKNRRVEIVILPKLAKEAGQPSDNYK